MIEGERWEDTVLEEITVSVLNGRQYRITDIA